MIGEWSSSLFDQGANALTTTRNGHATANGDGSELVQLSPDFRFLHVHAHRGVHTFAPGEMRKVIAESSVFFIAQTAYVFDMRDASL